MQQKTNKFSMQQKTNKFSYACFRIIRWLVWFFYPKITVEGIENLPADSAILVGNHAQMHGPICAELYIPGKRKTWCAHQMMYRREVPAYAFEDFWSGKPRWSHWFYKALSHLIAPLSACVFSNAQTIPVFHDARLLTTFKQTITALQNEENVIIFPECYTPHNNIVHQFQDKFVDVAKLYQKRTGKCVPFVPIYIAPKLKKVYIGKPIPFCPENPMEAERQRICNYLMDEITAIATGLPRHTVIPYPNISKKDYPSNISD